jgi:hypothetical protein
MALFTSATGFGPICDYIVSGQTVDGPIQSIEIISSPRIDTSFFTANFDLQTTQDDGEIDEDEIQEPSIGISTRDLNLVSSPTNFGSVCDRTISIQAGPVQQVDNLDQPNITLEESSDPSTIISQVKQNKPNLCRTVRLSTFTSSDNLGPVCDKNLQNFSDTGDLTGDSVLFCPTGAEGSGDDDEPDRIGTDPAPDDLTSDWPLPRIPGIRCYETAPGAIVCYPDDLPDDFGDAMVDPLGRKRRNNRYASSLLCGIEEDFGSWGVYEYVLPNTTDKIDVIIYGAGGGAGGSDQGQTFGTTRSANNCGGTGSELKFEVLLDTTRTNIITAVVGQGGRGGSNHINAAIATRHVFNRGGRGGHPGPRGLSGGGGSGGGATDFYINGRLVASAGGGGGGSGQGCWGFNPSAPGKPYGNWVSPPSLEVSRYPKTLSLPMQIVDTHPQWSNFMKQYVVWPSFGQDPRLGEVFDARLNLQFPSSGTYTFRVAGDNAIAAYISPFTQATQNQFIKDPYTEIFNGGVEGIPGWDADQDSGQAPPTPPSTLGPFTLIGFTTNFTEDPPVSFTYNIPTAGRYVLKFVFYNNRDDGETWDKNPAGIAVQILNGGSTLWSTRSYYGEDGHNRPFGDGGGSGGGGGNGGPAGLTSVEMGYTGGSCSNEDSTGQGGSAGASWILDHPSVSLKSFRQAPSGFIAGWQTPTTVDASVRTGGGGWGGMRPLRISLIFNGVEYPLQNSKGVATTVSIPGMGQGVWSDEINGTSFVYQYYWGKTLGDIEPANNIPNITRVDPVDPRSLQVSLRWVPIKTGSTWRTEVRLEGFPSWAYGTGWAVNDLLNGKMPAAQSDGTQPWLDKVVGDWSAFNRELLVNGKRATIGSAAHFNFQIKLTEVSNQINSTDGFSGRVFFDATYIEEDEFYELTED